MSEAGRSTLHVAFNMVKLFEDSPPQSRAICFSGRESARSAMRTVWTSRGIGQGCEVRSYGAPS
jgi:hypothetical protein